LEELSLLASSAADRLVDFASRSSSNNNNNGMDQTFGYGSSIISKNQRRSLGSDALFDFDDICEEMRIIFNEQCECGAYAEERSDMVTCTAASGLDASAHFNSDAGFALETMRVCKNGACTTIHYQNRTGSSCEASYGDSGGTPCRSCQVCSVDAEQQQRGMLGLEIDCSNVNNALSVNCTAVSDVLDLSGGGRISTGGIVGALLVSAATALSGPLGFL
jgi:hypothetical protein